MTASSNLYEVLGVSPFANADVIRAQYKKMALKHHPDKSGEDSKAYFQVIQEAYEVLGDRQKRSDYDNKVGTLSSKPRKQQKSRNPSTETPETEDETKTTQGPGWKDPNFVPTGGKEWYYYQSFTKRQWTGPTGGTQNFHHYDWSERSRWAEWFGETAKPWEVPRIRKAERLPFSGNDKKVADLKRQYHAHVEAVKTQLQDAWEAQGAAYAAFVVDGSMRLQKTDFEWRQLLEELEKETAGGSPSLKQMWKYRMTQLAGEQRKRAQDAATAVRTHASLFSSETKTRNESNRDQEAELDVIRQSARGVIASESAKLHFDDWVETMEGKLKAVTKTGEVEVKSLVAGKTASLRRQEKDFEAMLEQREGEVYRKLYGIPVQ